MKNKLFSCYGDPALGAQRAAKSGYLNAACSAVCKYRYTIITNVKTCTIYVYGGST